MGGKRGRKPTGKVALPLRVDPEIRAFLERQVKRPHLSLSAVAEYYLSAAISTAKTKKDDDQSTHDFCNLVCEIVRISRLVERKRGAVQFNWSANYFDFLAFRLAVTRVLDRLAPPGVPSRYKGAQSPEHLAEIAVTTVFSLFKEDASRLRAMGNARSAKRGSLFFVYPHVQATLLKEKASPQKGRRGG